MQLINTRSCTLDTLKWLTVTHHPRILHVFDQACNLINEHREVLSIVTPQIGNGPFNLVIENEISFSEHLNADSPISIQADQILLGDLTIHTGSAQLWSPRSDWEALHIKRDGILAQITNSPSTNYQPPLPISLLTTFSTSLVNADVPSTLTTKLAGLGQGLTPSGDDYLMGAIYAAWIIHPPEIASVLATKIANIAAPSTTSLSAAWLRSAGRGEAGILWHNYFNALIFGDSAKIQKTSNNILAIGETSGADALAGFIGTFISYAELETKLCHS